MSTGLQVSIIYVTETIEVVDLEKPVWFLPSGKLTKQAIPIDQVREWFPWWMFWRWFK